MIFQRCGTVGSCLLNFFSVAYRLVIWWDFCRFFKVLLEQLLKFLLNILARKESWQKVPKIESDLL